MKETAGPAPVNHVGQCPPPGYATLATGMHPWWIRAFVLFVGVALFANIQCYGTCGSAPCNSAPQPSPGSCHHDESSKDRATCMHQHSDLAGPEADAEFHKIGVVHTMPALMSVAPRLASPKLAILLPADRGSPPGESRSVRISVLRI
jgi:hypothetical protein